MNISEEHRKAGKGMPDLSGLITKEEVFEKLFAAWSFKPQIEETAVADALGRTLADDLFAKYDQPVVRASRMDGIAVKSAAFAGGMPDTSLWKPNVDYIRADTGDDFDDAFDAVIQIENVTILENGGVTLAEGTTVEKGSNVSPAGSNIRKGTQVGRAGKVISPLDMAAFVLGGYGTVKVYKKPVIAFIPTGSELVPAGSILERGQNFDSNSIMVNAMLERMGAEVLLYPIIKDDREQIEKALKEMISKADVVILNAGTSKGGEDFCVQYLREHGNMLFHGVKAVPGRPMSITIIDEKPVINMSGPAVGAYYGCLWLMTKVIDHMLAHTEPVYIPTAEATLTEKYGAPPFLSALSSFELSRAEDGTLLATPIPGRGPGSRGMSAGLMADAHYYNQLGEASHEAGDKIKVILAK